jgi:hypothetical protein
MKIAKFKVNIFNVVRKTKQQEIATKYIIIISI